VELVIINITLSQTVTEPMPYSEYYIQRIGRDVTPR